MKAILFFSLFLLGLERDFAISGCSGYILSNSVMQSFEKKLNFSDWPESLLRFRNALLQGDKVTVKSFFEFPINNPGNDIWFVADTRNVTKMSPNKIVPFQESDFDKYYGAILSMDFRKTLEEIDMEVLAKEKSTETEELKIVSPATSKMKAAYSESSKTLTLSLITKSPDFGQFTIDYHFKILPDGNIKFSYVKFII
jgi:hypothetical protein